MKNFLSKKTGKITAAIALLLISFWVALLFRPELRRQLRVLEYVLFGLIVFGGLWVALDLAFRAWERRRQARFDARVAAREGIEDRRREWAENAAELRRQGIDRYQLPVYLLVGEPQSGKSILLHNSDLYFPFGQTRLSGVGGTRGCDWWFTDQAVILDLAGRLFTHEGGASDEAEWEAFLQLLVEYRPQCPANGVILVLPCDGLASDAEPVVAKKAARMQNALGTLTNRLQARLPVYVVLTKADKVFGFAECVHRLDPPEKRHEMFGWSRALEKLEAPFDLAEAQAGFLGMVERGRLLRSQMLATARIPEALPEVDRFYAFPEELAALWPTLSQYLQRIFTESKLIDQFFFRGLYLTSGLQSGAPIAKLCAELLGTTGEADRRSLEKLFVRQRAYFIKDLVRERIFTEQGLVRPTRQRVLRARRNAQVINGLVGVLALCSIGWSVWSIRHKVAEAHVPEYEVALEKVKGLEEDDSLGEVVGSLVATDRAARRDGAFPPDFPGVFELVFKNEFAPRLREEAGKAFEDSIDPASFEEFLEEIGLGHALLSGLDLNEPAHRRIVARIGIDRQESRELNDALDSDYDLPAIQIPPSERQRVVDRMNRLWDGVLHAGKGWSPEGALGHVLACMELMEGTRIKPLDALDCEAVRARANAFRLAISSSRVWSESKEAFQVDGEAAIEALEAIDAQWKESRKQVGDAKGEWQRVREVKSMCSRPEYLQVPPALRQAVADPDLGRVCQAAFLSEHKARSEPALLVEDLSGRPAGGGEAEKIFLARCGCVEGAYLDAFPDLGALRDRLMPSGEIGTFSPEVSKHLGELHQALRGTGLEARGAWRDRTEQLIVEYETALVDAWRGDHESMRSQLMKHFELISRAVDTAARRENLARVVDLLEAELGDSVERAASGFLGMIPSGVSERFVEPLQRVAEELRKGQGSLDGARTSEKLVKARTQAGPAGDTGAAWVVEFMYKAMCEVVLKKRIRVDFLHDLRQLLGPGGTSIGLTQELWANPAGGARVTFFDKENELDRLMSRYHVARNPGSANAWSFEEFRSRKEDPEAWDTVAFLREFQAFLLGGAEKESATPRKLTFQISCEKSGLFVAKKFLSVNAAGKPSLLSFSKPEPLTIEWSLAEGNKDLTLCWSERPDYDIRQGDVVETIRGALAPFRLAWRGVEMDGAWRVPLTLMDSNGATQKADVIIRFGGSLALPRRPDVPPFSD